MDVDTSGHSDYWNRESLSLHHAVNAELRVHTDPTKNHPSATKKSSIQVRVVSGCFRAPEGTDLNGIS
ncbi:hypothetical protein OG206_12220 [Streptomyces sp. NBC_01341]|uniref:hypothetical protein n=1 Tax=Streptomyces sp. NBC_01341 TaxID=2903831 RepID=UPI002E0E4F90|nr:hypothetical protein OG206_12220 [Streptomyces sp. NBC_01341]